MATFEQLAESQKERTRITYRPNYIYATWIDLAMIYIFYEEKLKERNDREKIHFLEHEFSYLIRTYGANIKRGLTTSIKENCYTWSSKKFERKLAVKMDLENNQMIYLYAEKVKELYNSNDAINT